jgi:cytochrome c oxidase subunit II
VLVSHASSPVADRCAEYCGLDHASMDFEVRAVPADEFDAWLADEAAA